MRKYSLFIFLFLSLHFSAQVLSENQKLESLCRVWGFLKYYHPHVAKGNLNWDQQLFKKINELERINDKAALNNLYSNWIASLGKINECTECLQETDKAYFLKNFDLSWMDNSYIFTSALSQKLHYIENNRNMGNHYYIGKGGRKIFFRNENSYGSQFTSKQVNLLELFRYWNYVEYFFPYKYETDQNWNDTLTEMIPTFLNINNDKDYQLALAELVAKTDDSHAYLFSSLISLHLYGNKKLPVEYSYAEGKLVITKINGNRFHEESPFYIGDVIYDVNGKTIPQMVNSLGTYIPASNSWGKVNKVKSKLLFSNNDSLSVRLERNGQNIEIKAKTYFVKDIIVKKVPLSQKWKFLDEEKKIGYVNMGILAKDEVNEMYKDLQSSESIIFDLRNYPKLTIIPLSELLLPQSSVYYQFNFPEPNYPGKFYSRKNNIGVKNPDYYKGNVIVLVDENTQSQAETTTMMFKQHPKAKVIGSNTSGANGDIIKFKIADLDTCFTGLGAYYPDGRETQRIGIIPDILIKPSVEGIKNGKDEVLERALLYIKNKN
ncbi:S41 family peptidase [Chryseobacterium jejuense]|uniref:C-terminal processing protease CtpA/Prc, contains a PDZ domain n=1 Tax=Chryseobacterium jejuense TaxID=445960 RepID=A0A2X2WZ38_CHRJE|nr:S41 family peptidase [Chryseobacterium jejuense]SDJ34403.1 C-terminal processing protease CtpA/Prc, contains a PDZ domain [Chryseobacterium jejuense]SQB45754.1 Tail-specific protease precursor [Chryseobacterium jejuense]